MKTLLSRLNVAHVAICVGVCCVVLALASNFVGVVYAQSCPHTIPFSSLCIATPFPVCPSNTTGCTSASEWDVKSGDFQCMTWPMSYSTCFDSVHSAPCYTVYGCHVKVRFCTKNTDGANQPYNKVVKTWDSCPS